MAGQVFSLFITSRMTIQCFALICYRQAGKKSTGELLKSFIQNGQKVISQNLFSNTNSAVLKRYDMKCAAQSTEVDISDLCQAQE